MILVRRTIDLSNHAAADVAFSNDSGNDGTAIVHMSGGETFEVDFQSIDSIQFSDVQMDLGAMSDAPTADAGSDQTVGEGDTVALDAQASIVENFESDSWPANKSFKYYAYYELSQEKLISLPNPDEFCTPDRSSDLSGCVTKFVEDKMGCQSKKIKSDSQLPECSNSDQLWRLLNNTRDLQNSNENKVRKTSCIFSVLKM